MICTARVKFRSLNIPCSFLPMKSFFSCIIRYQHHLDIFHVHGSGRFHLFYLRLFLSELNNHFLKAFEMFRLFNRNTVKLSYSCIDNIKLILGLYNNNVVFFFHSQLANPPHYFRCRMKAYMLLSCS